MKIVRNTLHSIATAAALTIAAMAAPSQAQSNVLNLYSARHYSTDEALYANFTKATGITINRIEAGEDALLQRLKAEGANSPADVFLTVDAGRLWVAEQDGIFAPIQSSVLADRIPDTYRLASGTWFGFSSRARVIVVDRSVVKDGELSSYEDLANPKWKGQICTRSGSHVYMLSLLSSIIEHNGAEKAEAWAKGVVANLARQPKGGDTDQLKAVAAGECSIALSNTYYIARLLKSDKPDDRAIMQKLRVVWPNSAGRGVHMNVSGGGVVKTAPNRANAIKFLEYLASDEAQGYFANGNNEWPVVKTATIKNEALDTLGKFKADPINMIALGKNQRLAQEIVNRVGWK
ncbi:MAG: Fe(3+) ABC transporter substrate-binding protein [Burkholderiales bacterium]|nr:MAG: Fe(3+) ABC transporter substrate-binding protein [Betaproteobacteria bacterium]TAG28456.1 MAG: Fe(3+) ABC transporter substrate-binding protein [Burkholderiales bacterium]TAG45742.1 MAG: Fe(3+) ABC transporter substrate-binding protein [Betaproteobacteria bacterium]